MPATAAVPRRRATPAPGPRRAWSWVAAVCAALVAATSGCTSAATHDPAGVRDHAGVAASRQQAPAAPVRSAGSPPSAVVPTGASDVPSVAEVADLLRRRDAAVLAGDRAGYLATSAAADGDASTRFGALRALPLGRWESSVSAVRAADGGKPGTDAVAEVLLSWALADADLRPASLALRVGLVAEADGWRVAGERAVDGRPSLWDFGGPVVTASGRFVTVVAVGTERAEPPDPTRFVAPADAAVRAVDRVWGRRWDRRLVLVVPATRAALADAVGRDRASFRVVPAVAAGERRSPTGGTPPQRVWLNPRIWPDLGPAARGILLRHEALHVAARSAGVGAPPRWLEEGLAEYVGYLGSGVPDEIVAGGAAARAATGRPARGLPPDAAFEPGSAGFDLAYQWSWLAVSTLVHRAGLDAAVAAYRRLLATPTPPTPGQRRDLADRVLRAETGWGLAEVERAWHRAARRLGRG